ncbi:MAG: hypothetical protein K0S37_4794 [Microbacterium sp.]|nr:hypothetical protein [Microbacterium sp.]
MTSDITPLIAFGGLKESGKDAAANCLRDDHGYVILGMSDVLHEAALVLNPIVRAQITAHVTLEVMTYAELVERVGFVQAKTNPEVRRFLIALGTKFGRRMIGEDIWADLMRDKIHSLLDADQPVAITGIRFHNELRMIEQLDGVTVWVERPAARAKFDPATADESEKTLTETDFAYALDNVGTLQDLRGKVAEIARAVQ